ncbi:hypothetical protein Pst134EA_005439 [Puccinia striiformis f. sp. tritici]|uniref:hypothetical protein n=1 Tax=Puccinia striiformis f. sp. tritici TaxID=168172 RepID=UPI0020088510|nr:hypothetical protein Pst134EA_005439 [Puccinia striiformis f. sp. tritici]KAH9471546.1 hypothetical protein Pst134EA_005439 [Puccinia striiformis f. sp. tritici]KAI9618945.1 hypothetical protein H4Q26_012202 [Puccinia striiformis f. sp. tritici PST-130]
MNHNPAAEPDWFKTGDLLNLATLNPMRLFAIWTVSLGDLRSVQARLVSIGLSNISLRASSHRSSSVYLPKYAQLPVFIVQPSQCSCCHCASSMKSGRCLGWGRMSGVSRGTCQCVDAPFGRGTIGSENCEPKATAINGLRPSRTTFSMSICNSRLWQR